MDKTTPRNMYGGLLMTGTSLFTETALLANIIYHEIPPLQGQQT